MKGEQELRYESRLLVRPPALPARNTNKGGVQVQLSLASGRTDTTIIVRKDNQNIKTTYKLINGSFSQFQYDSHSKKQICDGWISGSLLSFPNLFS
jgi:hypothetical protein